MTALHAAASEGHAHVVRMLLDAGADALTVDAELRTPLHLVAAAGHGICIKPLLEAGSDPEGIDAGGMTPLMLAEEGRHMGSLRTMRLFLQRREMGAGGRAHRRVGITVT
jgi:ankyrin repeat protein|tara:strand:- start:706 stop:1035 length:330 start_codon:yes stop_codon:yes gene_type:complete